MAKRHSFAIGQTKFIKTPLEEPVSCVVAISVFWEYLQVVTVEGLLHVTDQDVYNYDLQAFLCHWLD